MSNSEFHNLLSAVDLLKLNLPEVNWFIEDVLPSGLIMLVGRPKSGKSFLALDLGISISTGQIFLEKFQTIKARVLYISNEDSLNRLQNRLRKIVANKNIENSIDLNNFFAEIDFPKLNDQGLEKLKKIIHDENIKLVIVDTFFKQVVFGTGNRNYYAKEYELTGKLQTFATDNNIGFLFVHHTKKGEVDNISDAVLGTTGIAGSADLLWLIDTKGGKSILEMDGKDVEPQSFAMEFVDGLWRYKGSYTESLLTPEREEILELLKSENREMRTSEIAKALGKKPNNISTLLKKMVAEGVLKNIRTGVYILN